MKVDVVFLIEHRAREVYFVEYLCSRLEKYGISTIILSLEFELFKLPIISSKILVLPWAIHTKNWPFPILNFQMADRIISLNWEQYLIPLAMEFRRPADDFTRQHVHHYSWGPFYSRFLKESGVPNSRIIRGNNPSVFNYSRENRNFNKLDKRIFCPVNFAWSFKTDNDVKKISKGKNFDIEASFQIRDYAIKSRNNFIQVCSELADSGYEIIFKPHPSIPLDAYSNLEIWDDRIKLVKDGKIEDYLNNVCLVLSSWSTTLLVCTQLGIPNISVKYKEYPEPLNGEWLKDLKTCESSKEILNYLKSDWKSDFDVNNKLYEPSILIECLILLSRSTIKHTRIFKLNFSVGSLFKLIRSFLYFYNVISVPKGLKEDNPNA